MNLSSLVNKIFGEHLKAKYSSDTPLSFSFDEEASMSMTSLNYWGLQECGPFSRHTTAVATSWMELTVITSAKNNCGELQLITMKIQMSCVSWYFIFLAQFLLVMKILKLFP